MSVYDSNITFNSVKLKVQSLTPIKTQKTRKSIIGKTLTEIRIIGLNTQQWELDIDGVIIGTTAANLSTNRSAIEALEDVTPHAYVDGIHNGTYILKSGSLIIKDTSEDGGGKYNYSLTLVEE